MSARVTSLITDRKRKVPHPPAPKTNRRDQVAQRLSKAIDPSSRSLLGKTYTDTGIFKDVTPTSKLNALSFPGDDGQDGAAMAHADSEDDLDESDQEHAAAEREKYLAQARKARLDIQKVVQTVPEDVAGICQGTCYVFRRAWTKGREKDTNAIIENANKSIRQLNRENKRPEDQFNIPGDDILTHIDLFRQYIIKWYSLKEGGSSKRRDREKAAKTLSALLINVLPKLAACGLSYKSLAGELVQGILHEIVADADLKRGASKKLQEYLDADLTMPSSYQASIANHAEEPLSSLFKHIEAGRLQEAKESIPRVEAVNQQLQKSNRDVGFKERDHVIPTKFLSKMLQADGLQSEEEFATTASTIKAQFASILYSIGYTNLGASLASYGEANAQKLPQDVIDEVEELVYQDPLEEDLRIREQLLRSAPKDMETAHPSAGLLATEYSTGDYSEAASIASDLSDIMDGVPGPYITADGKTQWGQVIKVQRVGFGYRIIFNRGTTMHPVFEMRPGSCLPKVIIGDLARRFKLEKHVSREPWQVKLVTDIAELVGGKITRFRVLWRNQQVTFPTRSELSAIVGKAMVDGPGGIRERLQAKKDRIEEWHELCRARGWHPDYRPPNTRKISPKQKALYPWIFGPPDLEDDDGHNVEVGGEEDSEEDNEEDDEGDRHKEKGKQRFGRGLETDDAIEREREKEADNEERPSSAMDIN